MDNHCTITFDENSFVIQDKNTQKVLYRGCYSNGLYPFSSSSSDSAATFSSPACLACSTPTTASASAWHFRLGHPSTKKFHHIISHHHLGFSSSSLSNNGSSLCEHCCVSKSHRLPFCLSNPTVNKPLALIHTDVWGPFSSSVSGFKYYV